MNNRIEGQVDLYRRDGHWYLLVYAPDWVIADVAQDWETSGRHLWVHNYSGLAQDGATHSMLFGVIEQGQPASAQKEG